MRIDKQNIVMRMLHWASLCVLTTAPIVLANESICLAEAPPANDAAHLYAPFSGRPETFYWILRDPSAPVGGGFGGSDDDHEAFESGGSRCVPLTIAWDSARSAKLKMDFLYPLHGNLNFTVLREGDGWALRGPEISGISTSLQLAGACYAPFTIEAGLESLLFFQTSRGPIFRNKAQCESLAKKGYKRVLKDKKWHYAQDKAPVFDRGDCEKAFAETANAYRILANSTETQRLDTLQKVLKVWSNGGTLFQLDEQGQRRRCQLWQVNARDELHVKMTSTFVVHSAQRKELREYKLIPLENRAVGLLSYTEDNEGIASRGGSWTAPLLFASKRFYLDGMWFFLSRSTCEAATHHQ